MDNITHTLVGAALAEAGLKKRTPLASATLMIGANFPDIDVIAVPLGESLAWRRGATHGFLALLILPFVLAWLMRWYDRAVRLRRNSGAPPADMRQLVLLAAIAILTHPTLDFMNTYGMRWLMPFVDKWFYADGLFIVDLYLMIALAAGVVLARRRKTEEPARFSLVFLVAYVTAMLTITGLGRLQVQNRFPGTRIMVSPLPLTPWTRAVLVDDGSSYQYGRFGLGTGVTMERETLPIGSADPAVAAAREAPEAQAFLKWARFPFYRVSREGSDTVVRMGDARYTGVAGQGWATAEVRLP
ncbi:MAG TPA: metal-dependent hydrolase [Gemmatimonadaceae bacterium]|nr:metal-dependent hydrolase [Gemmatimonadaceae bacterium]